MNLPLGEHQERTNVVSHPDITKVQCSFWVYYTQLHLRIRCVTIDCQYFHNTEITSRRSIQVTFLLILILSH